MKDQPIYFRCDEGPLIGSGHLMRCLALAQAWQDLGGRAVFLTYCGETLCGRLRDEGFTVQPLKGPHPDPDDLEQVLHTIAATPGAWLVLDGYHFQPAYHRALHEADVKLLIIDDMGHLPAYHAQVILNQNLEAERTCYPAPGATRLVGPSFALLRREFDTWRDWKRVISPRAQKILVTMGGADPDNMTLRAIEALNQLDGIGWEIVVVVGAANPHQESLHGAAFRCRHSIHFERSVRDISKRMAWADLAVSAAGSTCWELCFMALPSVLVELATNQTNLARALQACGAAVNAGWQADVTTYSLAQMVSSLANDPVSRTTMARHSRLLVDGFGARRVISAMRSECHDLMVRRAGRTDCRMIWEWANDTATRAASFTVDPIPWERHVEWFDKKLCDPSSFIYIVADPQRNPIGMVRYEVDGSEAVISINIAPEMRGRGYGTVVLRSAAVKFFADSNVARYVALVKPENRASAAVFERAGYVRTEGVLVNGAKAHRFVLDHHGC